MEPPPGGGRPSASPKPAKLVFERLASEDDEASPASSEDTGRLLEQNVARRLVQCGEEGKTPKATQHITPTQEMNARRRRKRAEKDAIRLAGAQPRVRANVRIDERVEATTTTTTASWSSESIAGGGATDEGVTAEEPPVADAAGEPAGFCGAGEFHQHDFSFEEHASSAEVIAWRARKIEPEGGGEGAEGALGAEAWDRFYERHAVGFFKPKRWVMLGFPELATPSAQVLEVGCGNGALALTVLQLASTAVITACDCSATALELLRQQAAKHFPAHAARLIVPGGPWDVARWEERPAGLAESSFDVVTCIFTLSAIEPARHGDVIANLARLLRPGGTLCFRDYGLYDLSQLRLKSENHRWGNAYKRADGTLSYFFEQSEVAAMMLKAGLEAVEGADYNTIRALNKKVQQSLRRVFVHSRYRRPM